MSDNIEGRSEIVERSVPNPFGTALAEQRGFGGGLVSVEQQRAIAEVQARMIIARSNPRDAIRCTDLILQDCTRPSLAETALYQYVRGHTEVCGPSIRLAEAIARRWGNIASGIKEISRTDGYSECVAYAWDLETGYYDERQFQVRHWRDTKSGGYRITDERDIYETVANMGQRRKRAVLLSVIPGDVVEAAVNQCNETLRASADNSPEAIKRMIQFFGSFGVTREQIEARCQCHAEAIRPAQIIQLRRIYASLKDGMSEPQDWFPVQPEGPKTGTKLDKFEQRHGRSEPAEQNAPLPRRAGSAERERAWSAPSEEQQRPNGPQPPAEAATAPPQASAETADEPPVSLLRAGDGAAQDGVTVFRAWWDRLASRERGMLGARGRGTGPRYAEWMEKAKKADARRSEPAPAEETGGDPPSAESHPGGVPESEGRDVSPEPSSPPPAQEPPRGKSTLWRDESFFVEIPLVAGTTRRDIPTYAATLCTLIDDAPDLDALDAFLAANHVGVRWLHDVGGHAEVEAQINKRRQER